MKNSRAYKWAASIPKHYWAWCVAFLTLGIGWGHAIAIYPPTSYQGLVDTSAVFRMGLTTGLGGIIASVFLLQSRSLNNNRRITALWLELVGLILLTGGPLQYAAVQLGFLIDGSFKDRYALAWFAVSMMAFLGVRFAILIPILKKEHKSAKDQGKQ